MFLLMLLAKKTNFGNDADYVTSRDDECKIQISDFVISLNLQSVNNITHYLQKIY